MTYPRSHLASTEEPGFYHCVNRCVRRALQSTPPATVWNLSDAPRQWLRQVQGTENRYHLAIGSAEALTKIGTPTIFRKTLIFCRETLRESWVPQLLRKFTVPWILLVFVLVFVQARVSLDKPGCCGPGERVVKLSRANKGGFELSPCH